MGKWAKSRTNRGFQRGGRRGTTGRRWLRWGVIGVLAMLVALAVVVPGAWAQEYKFSLDRNISHVIVNRDGSADIEYWLTYTCAMGAHPIDIIDVGLPNDSYRLDTSNTFWTR